MRYEAGKPIESRPGSAWLVEAEGRRFLQVWHPEATITEVVRHCRVFHERFTVAQVWVGEFEVVEVIQSYAPDGRKVDQDENFAT